MNKEEQYRKQRVVYKQPVEQLGYDQCRGQACAFPVHSHDYPLPWRNREQSWALRWSAISIAPSGKPWKIHAYP